MSKPDNRSASSGEPPAGRRPGDGRSEGKGRAKRKAGRGREQHGPPDSSVPGLPARQCAARLLAAVIDKASPLDALTDDENGNPAYLVLDGRDRALVRAILLVALRHRVRLGALIDGLLEKPLPAGARNLEHILHVAAAQIVYLDIPDSAAVNLAVAQAKADPRSTRFSSLVNAILRRISAMDERARRERIGEVVDAPVWFAERLVADYGAARADAILKRHESEAPIDLTLHPQRAGADGADWARRLGGALLPTGSIRLARTDGPITLLDGFVEGAWWVQDAAAALPARLLAPKPGERVADLCAAPGGKTAQLAATGASVTALDLSANRLKRLISNLERLHLEARTTATDLRKWRPDAPFEAVLLDAPCSSTGTIRRHPDVGWTKTAADVEKLATLQEALLEAALSFVAPGGRLVFSNCSLFRREGEMVVERILARHDQFVVDPIAPEEVPGLETAIDERGRLRTTPADMEAPPGLDERFGGVDGFFAARLIRRV